ncbi:MAG: hypothetical protein HGA66_07940 [Holophaga sp.]|nr:hypothetical protein [Holophaga sp.]
MAAKLPGVWEGRWEFAGSGGKCTARIEVEGKQTFKGTTVWFDTPAGDLNDKFTGATLKDGKFSATEKGVDFEVTLSEDGATMTGAWTTAVASGPLLFKKKAE